MTASVLLARQPIFDRQLRVVGYELLYRPLDSARPAVFDGDGATATVCVHAILDVGLEALAGSSRAYFNVTHHVLRARLYEFLPPERVVLEILEDTQVDSGLMREIVRAKQLGYRIALDDFLLSGPTGALAPLADVIKVEVPKLDADGLKRHADMLARPGLELLAEKVETHAVHQCCVEAGYDLFQGFFFARPQPVRSRTLPAERLMLLRLFAEIQDPSAALEEIETLVAANVTLGYKLMRYVNSALHGLAAPIESIRHAIVMLGLDHVRICIAMLLLAQLDGKPHELVVTALVRARYCQLLGGLRGANAPEKHFTVGLLSVLDAFMDRPMNELLENITIAPDLKAALVRREGPLGEILEAAIACEQADWQRLSAAELDVDVWKACYLEALKWATEMDESLTR